MKLRSGWLMFLVFLAAPAGAQQNFIFDSRKADSLERLLPQTAGNGRIDVLNQLSFLYNRNYPGRSDSLAREALNLSVENDYTSGQAFALYNQGILFYLDAGFDKATEKLYASLDICNRLRDTSMMIDVYNQLANAIFFSLADRDKAIEYLEKSLELSLASGNNLRTAQIYASMGYVSNVSLRDGAKGKQMFENYYRYIEGIPVHRIERALMIASNGDSYKLLGDTRTAIDKYLTSLKIYDPDQIEERALMAQICTTLGDMYRDTGKPDSARFYYHSAISLSGKFGHLYGLYRAYCHLATYYFLMGDDQQAITCCDSVFHYGTVSASLGSLFLDPKYDRVPGVSMEIYIPLTKGYKKHLAWSYLMSAHEILLKIYEASGEASRALSVLKDYSALKDSIAKYTRNQELKEIQAKYDTERKEEQILLLSQANQLQELKISQGRVFLFGMGGLVIMIIMLAIILIRQNKLKADHQAVLLKQRLFRSQMNPHFIFNALGSIQSAIISEAPDKAVRYLSRFSKLMRSILDSSAEEWVTLEEELETIGNYLELQKIRYAGKFDYRIDIEAGIDVENSFIPPMLAQPFIENAIEHGIRHKEGKGKIQVRIRRSNNRTIEQSNNRTVEQTIRQGADTVFEVEDDGVGREKAREMLFKQDKHHKSLATAITQERIAALNRRSKKRITLEITDLKDELGNARGTRVRFGIWLKEIIVILLLLSATSFSAPAKPDLTSRLDSLAMALENTQGTRRLEILYQLALLITPYDLEKAVIYVDEEISLSQSMDDELVRGKVFHNLGDIEYYSDDFIQALEYFNKAIDIFESHNFYLGLGHCYTKLVLIFYHTGNWEKALEYIPKSRDAFANGHHYRDLAAHYWAIGYFNNNYMKNYAESKAALNEAFRLAVEYQLPSAYLGGITASLGHAYNLNGELDTAIVIYIRAISYLDETNMIDKGHSVQLIRELGNLYQKSGKTDSALFYLKLALDRANEMTYVFGKTYISLSLASVYYQNGEFEMSVFFDKQVVENAMIVFEKGKGYMDDAFKMAPVYAWDVHIPIMTSEGIRRFMIGFLITAFNRLSKSHEALGNYPEACRYYQSYISWKDSSEQARRQSELYGLQIRFDTERKDQQITLLEQENELQQFRIRQNRVSMASLGAAVIISTLFSVLLIRQNKLKADHQAVLLKQRLFRSQMNPHFIFNALGSIQSSIINEEPDKAARYLSRFSKLMRSILDSSMEEVVSLEEELETIGNYLELQKVRYSDKFDYSIDIEPGFDVENSIIPPMLAQPFIENAIEHGIKHKEGKGRIQVRIRRSNNRTIEQSNNRTVEQTIRQRADTVFEVEDDGVGREKAREILLKQDKNHKSLATAITQERIAALNRRSKQKIKLEIIDLKDEIGGASGTLVRFEIQFI